MRASLKDRMGVMRKILLLSAVVLLSAGIVRAEVTPDETLDPNYMMNNGFSETLASDVIIQQARSAGVPASDIQDKAYYNKPFIKAIRNVFIYLDPALEDNFRFHHDVKLTPSVHDL